MNFRVIILPQAERDLDVILGWLRQRSFAGAQAWFQGWLQTVKKLEQTAGSCGLAPEDEDHEPTIRQVLFKTRRGRAYRAIFTICEDRVYVLHIRGSGQNRIRPEDFRLPE